VSLNDMADRTPQVLHDGEVIDLGKGKRVRYIDTPHIPHGWDAGVLYEETTRTLLCGDLFTQLGDGPALTESDVVGPAIAAEDIFLVRGVPMNTVLAEMYGKQEGGTSSSLAVRMFRISAALLVIW